MKRQTIDRIRSGEIHLKHRLSGDSIWIQPNNWTNEGYWYADYENGSCFDKWIGNAVLNNEWVVL